MEIPIIIIAVTNPKNPTAPLPLLKFFPTYTKPLASAKSAIDQIKK
jgi:2',3'-cyclic-nucleotide 2'-phosphodiesterase (5'-nucleotidase family)